MTGASARFSRSNRQQPRRINQQGERMHSTSETRNRLRKKVKNGGQGRNRTNDTRIFREGTGYGLSPRYAYCPDHIVGCQSVTLSSSHAPDSPLFWVRLAAG